MSLANFISWKYKRFYKDENHALNGVNIIAWKYYYCIRIETQQMETTILSNYIHINIFFIIAKNQFIHVSFEFFLLDFHWKIV